MKTLNEEGLNQNSIIKSLVILLEPAIVCILKYLNKHPKSFVEVLFKDLCIFSDSVLLTSDVYRQLDEYLEPRVSKIAKDVAEYNSKQAAASALVEGSSRFVYFNRMNLATKSTVHLDNRKSGNITVTKDVLRILADINSEHWR